MILIIIAILVGGFYYFNGSSTGSVVSPTDSSGNVDKVFVVDSSYLRFYINGVENPDIKVKQGDKVRIEFGSQEGFHDWVVDEFNAKTSKVTAGNSTSVEFVADKKGTFGYYCIVGRHRANGMKGRFIVEWFFRIKYL